MRSGSLVKLNGLEKKFNGQVGRVVDLNLVSDGVQTGLVAVLLAPKGNAAGVWVAVQPENLILEQQ